MVGKRGRGRGRGRVGVRVRVACACEWRYKGLGCQTGCELAGGVESPGWRVARCPDCAEYKVCALASVAGGGERLGLARK